MFDTRRKNANWTVCDGDTRSISWEGARLAVLMDIRDELQTINMKLSCFRIPKALDAMIELGRKKRRRKRNERNRRR